VISLNAGLRTVDIQHARMTGDGEAGGAMSLRMDARERLQDGVWDRRAGATPRRLARERQFEYLRRNWRYLSVFAIATVPLLALTWLFSSWVQPYVVGALIASAGWMIAMQVVVHSGAATRMAGEQAETWTASELRRLRRQGAHVANAIRLRQYGDIDHIVVGPCGLIVIETKWMSEGNASWFDARLRQAVQQVRNDAFSVHAMFLNEVPDAAVTRVVVVWGAGARHLAASSVPHDGVVVCNGRDLRSWIEALPADRLDPATVANVWARLEATIERRDTAELERRGAPPRSLSRWVADVAAVTLAGAIALLAVLAATGVGPMFGLVAWLGTMAAGLRAQARAAIAPYANGWLVGSAVGGGILVGLMPYWTLHALG
jgi:hypothetical protein